MQLPKGKINRKFLGLTPTSEAQSLKRPNWHALAYGYTPKSASQNSKTTLLLRLDLLRLKLSLLPHERDNIGKKDILFKHHVVGILSFDSEHKSAI